MSERNIYSYSTIDIRLADYLEEIMAERKKEEENEGGEEYGTLENISIPHRVNNKIKQLITE